MFMQGNVERSSGAVTGLSRRMLLRLALVAATPLSSPALAGTGGGDPTATITVFNAALLSAMKAGAQTGFSQRFQSLAPAVEQAFDLPAVLSLSVGSNWSSLPPDQQARLLEAFRRYTVASYVANFDHYNGQTFSVAPTTRSLDGDRVVVQSRIVPASGEATELDYVMKQGASVWKIVDVLAAGSISRVAVQRSDFRHLLSRGGGDALLTSLQRKASDLSGGALA
jgi:phospholipid transport system substrate-binding protein